MARKSPAQVRADAWQPSMPGLGVHAIPGLSRRGVAALVRLERTRLWPGAVAHFLDLWSQFVRDPALRLRVSEHGCGVPECCPHPDELRRVLEIAAHALPPKDARLLRRRIARLDEQS